MANGDDVPIEDLKALEVSGEDEETPGYKAPAKVDLATLQKMDADDESLQRYKQILLGGAGKDNIDEGGNNVLVKALRFCVGGRDDVVMDLTDAAKIKKLTDTPFTIKEGCEYKLKICFRVQREIVSGLRFFNAIYRKGIRVDKNSYMVGSYGPKAEVQEFLTPQEFAPKGMLARGAYTSKSKFCDDDNNIYLEWEWNFNIKKDW